MFAFCVTAHESIPMYTYFSKNVSMYLQIYTLKYILKLTYYIKDSCFKKKKKVHNLLYKWSMLQFGHLGVNTG